MGRSGHSEERPIPKPLFTMTNSQVSLQRTFYPLIMYTLNTDCQGFVLGVGYFAVLRIDPHPR